ncbi:radical SAM protein [Mesorhizobium waimense]|uniref:Radical SAM protein n=1 Tax=Mesorhizobium waimense TaxID=1300307 RepID=A0A3A5KCH4_9HYPH|nr:radical SAM protein [Mesorhizobium waimense]RJT32604.1 radical SAM protein [Mesorhizobium waimense]
MAYRVGSHWFAGPVHVDFNLTNRCNLACRHCHASSGEPLLAELGTADVMRIVDSLYHLGVLSIAFAGGEPLVRPDIAEILRYAAALPGMSVSVITNGLSLTPALRAKLAPIKNNLTINVSIEGSTAENFGRLRQSPSGSAAAPALFFERIKQSIRALVADGFTVSTNMTITRQSLKDVVATHRLAVVELGASALVAIKFFPGGYGSSLAHILEPPVPAWLDVFAELTRYKLAGDLPGLQVSVPAAWEFYLPLIAADLDIVAAEQAWGYVGTARASSNGPRDIGDAAGFADLCIDSDGKVYPSVLLAGEPDALAGDLRRDTLASIWRHSTVLNGLRRLTVSDIEGACQFCALKDLCGGGSRARAFALTRRLSGPDATCPLIAQPGNAGARDEARQNTPPRIPAVRRSWTVGVGRHAIRVLRLDRGCEVRTRGHVWHCPEGTAVALEAAAEADGTSDLTLALRHETAGNGLCPDRVGKILAGAAAVAGTEASARP